MERAADGGGAGGDAVGRAVEAGDLDELGRTIDGLCASGSWDALLDLRDRCDRAVERGRQLWPAARHAEYRLALEAPGRWAAAVLVEGAGRFAPGPLPEVAASTHSWDDLAPHLPPGPPAATFLHERVVRGEDLTAVEMPGPDVLELPPVLQGWEPAYAVAVYRPDHGEFPAPPVPRLAPMPSARAGAAGDGPDRGRRSPAGASDSGGRPDAGGAALAALVEHWREESEAVVDVAVVDPAAPATGTPGPGPDGEPPGCAAVAALRPPDPHGAEVDGRTAMALMAWAAACGGVHGRRRGAAAGRLDAWMAVAAIGGAGEWPLDPTGVGAALGALRWTVWDPGGAGAPWSLHLAVDDPRTGRAWAISARDAG